MGVQKIHIVEFETTIDRQGAIQLPQEMLENRGVSEGELDRTASLQLEDRSQVSPGSSRKKTRDDGVSGDRIVCPGEIGTGEERRAGLLTHEGQIDKKTLAACVDWFGFLFFRTSEVHEW